MAWTALTVVTQSGHKKRWNVLAAAGLRGQVRLLHVRAGFCCGVIRAHKKAIATLCFSPTHETHLFSKTFSPYLQGSPSTLPGLVGDSCGWQSHSRLPMLAPIMVEAMWLCGQLTGLQILAFPPTCSVALKLSDNLGYSVLGILLGSAVVSPMRVMCEQRPTKDSRLVWPTVG